MIIMTTTTTTTTTTSTTVFSTTTTTTTTTSTTRSFLYMNLNKYLVCKKDYFETTVLRRGMFMKNNSYFSKILEKNKKYFAYGYTSDYNDMIKSYDIKIGDNKTIWVDVDYFYTDQELRREKLNNIDKCSIKET